MNQPVYTPRYPSPPASTTHSRPAVIGAAGYDENMLPAIPAWYGLVTAAGTAAGAYHGYKRNNSVGWAIGWGLLGGLFPFITVPVALVQGFGKKKGRK